MSNAVTQAAPSAPATIRSLLEGDEFKRQVAKALPSHLKPDRFIRIALTAVMRTPKLKECDHHSFFNALLTLSQFGIEPDGRRAHLIPFNNTKRKCVECQLIVDYKGLAELAMRSGVVANLHADIVCDGDEFEYDRGQIIRHKIDFKAPRGKMYATYAICRFKDGTEKCEVMSREDIEDIRKRSRAANAGPWVTDWVEMSKKTVFRRLSKWLPLSAEFRDAVEADDDQLPAIADTPVRPAGPLVDVVAFEMPSAIEDAPETEMDDPAEAEAGLAPEPAKAATQAPAEDPPQVQLSKLVLSSGFTFSDFQSWGDQSGVFPEATSLSGFREVKTADAVRILKANAKGAVLQGLAKVKGGAA